MSRVAVIGGGAAGMMAACAASKNNEVYLFEKNDKLGKKIYITGKGRCNVTNDCSVEDFFKNIATNQKFLISALYGFTPADLMEFIESNGVQLKIERGNRVFPASDKASDITKSFEKYLAKNGVNILLNTTIEAILTDKDRAIGVKTVDRELFFDKIIVCTGGVSYPTTGSTGDGYRFAKTLGHTIIEPKPALTGINLKGDGFKDLQGLSLKNVVLNVFNGSKKIYSEFGEMLFTHFGVSGPIVLSASSIINKLPLENLKLSIDLKPALSDEELDLRILKDFNEYKNKDFRNSLNDLLPKALISIVIERSGIPPLKKVNEITVKERKNLLSVLKSLSFDVHSLRPIEEGIITSGGVNVKEVNPKTMESKIVKGLYFAGEVLDVDAFTGGFNLQIAFSTGFAAGNEE